MVGKGSVREGSGYQGTGERYIAMAIGVLNGEHCWSGVVAVREGDLGRKADGKVMGNEDNYMGDVGERGGYNLGLKGWKRVSMLPDAGCFSGFFILLPLFSLHVFIFLLSFTPFLLSFSLLSFSPPFSFSLSFLSKLGVACLSIMISLESNKRSRELNLLHFLLLQSSMQIKRTE